MYEIAKKLIILPLKIERVLQVGNCMMTKYIKKAVVLVTIIVASHSISAQTMEVGLFGGGSYYLGELNTALHFSETQLAFGLLARFNLNSRWAIKAGYNRGLIKSDDSKNAAIADQGLNFQTTLNDITAVAEFNFLEYFTGSKKNYFTPLYFRWNRFLHIQSAIL